jgi:hypothetical protein
VVTVTMRGRVSQGKVQPASLERYSMGRAHGTYKPCTCTQGLLVPHLIFPSSCLLLPSLLISFAFTNICILLFTDYNHFATIMCPTDQLSVANVLLTNDSASSCPNWGMLPPLYSKRRCRTPVGQMIIFGKDPAGGNKLVS